MTTASRSRAVPTARLALCLALLAGLGLGCAFGEIYWSDPLTRGYTLREAQHRYTALVRWSKWHEAVRFVDDDARDAFLAAAPDVDELRFTDFEIGSVDLDDNGESTVEVTYTVYTPTTPFEVEIVEIQHWKRDGVTNDWRVRPRFEGLEKLALR